MANLTIASLRTQLHDALGYTLKVNTKGLKNHYKYVACHGEEEIFGADRLQEMLDKIAASIATKAEKEDIASIKLDAAKKAVLEQQPTQTSFQEIASIFDANGWDMTPEQEIEFHEKHWLVLPSAKVEKLAIKWIDAPVTVSLEDSWKEQDDQDTENLYLNENLGYGWSVIVPHNDFSWCTIEPLNLGIGTDEEYINTKQSNWIDFVNFSSDKWGHPEEYREEWLRCELSEVEPVIDPDDREFDQELSGNYSTVCTDGCCMVKSLPILPEDIKTNPVTNLIAYINACSAIAKAFQGQRFDRQSQPSNFADMMPSVRHKLPVKGFFR